MTSCCFYLSQLNCNTGLCCSATFFCKLSHIYCNPTFFKIFFFGAELRNKVANLTAELDASEYRTFVYPRTIKGANTAEFIKTKREYDKLRAEVEEMGRIADEIEAAMYEAHLDEFVNTFFEEKFGEIGENDILVLEIEF